MAPTGWDMYKTYPLEKVGLNARTENSLRRRGITTVGQILNMTVRDLLNVNGFGLVSLGDIANRMAAFAADPELPVELRVEDLEKEVTRIRDAIMSDAGLRQAYSEAKEVEEAMQSVKEKGNG
jgi:DNA-directed RNA polymerase alpha subunit